MKTEQIYLELKALAEKLGIAVSEQNFRTTGVPVKSGLCTVRGESRLLVDKHRPLRDRIDILAECLSGFPLQDVYIVPAVREYLDRYADNNKDNGIL